MLWLSAVQNYFLSCDVLINFKYCSVPVQPSLQMITTGMVQHATEKKIAVSVLPVNMKNFIVHSTIHFELVFIVINVILNWCYSVNSSVIAWRPEEVFLVLWCLGGKRDQQYFGHNFDKVKYTVVNFCEEYHEGNAKLQMQKKSALPNQCCYFTLRIRQWVSSLFGSVFRWDQTAQL